MRIRNDSFPYNSFHNFWIYIIKIRKLIKVIGNTPWNQIMWTATLTLQNSHNTSEVSYLVCLEIKHSLHFWYQTKLPYFSVHVWRKDTIGEKTWIFFKFIYFNWRLISLQYCSGFFHTLTWISHGCTMCSPSWTPLPPPSPCHPSGSSQCTSPEHPVSCIKPWQAICFTYDNIHVSMLLSQIIPPSPSPTQSKRLFYTSVFLLLFCV